MWSLCDRQHHTTSTNYSISYDHFSYAEKPPSECVLFGKQRRNARSHKSCSGSESHRPAAVDGCLELQSVNNPAVKQGSPPCGINKTEELVKGMVEGRNTASTTSHECATERIFPPSDALRCGSKGRFFWLSRSRRFLCSGKT